MKEYKITVEQLSDINNIKQKVQDITNRISDLCEKEQADIVYGFELGRLYTYLIDISVQLQELDYKIEEQILN